MRAKITVQIGVYHGDNDFMLLERDPQKILTEVLTNWEHDFKLKGGYYLATGEPHLLEYEATTDKVLYY